jgi:hypothetical protein
VASASRFGFSSSSPALAAGAGSTFTSAGDVAGAGAPVRDRVQPTASSAPAAQVAHVVHPSAAASRRRGPAVGRPGTGGLGAIRAPCRACGRPVVILEVSDEKDARATKRLSGALGRGGSVGWSSVVVRRSQCVGRRCGNFRRLPRPASGPARFAPPPPPQMGFRPAVGASVRARHGICVCWHIRAAFLAAADLAKRTGTAPATAPRPASNRRSLPLNV